MKKDKSINDSMVVIANDDRNSGQNAISNGIEIVL